VTNWRTSQERLKLTLPLEVRDTNHRYALCANSKRIAEAIERARQAKAEDESWSVSGATLERWRCEGIGPVFLKLRGRVLYRQCDIEQYEESCLSASTRHNVCREPSGIEPTPHEFGNDLR
jgi:hypothetical protein